MMKTIYKGRVYSCLLLYWTYIKIIKLGRYIFQAFIYYDNIITILIINSILFTPPPLFFIKQNICQWVLLFTYAFDLMPF